MKNSIKATLGMVVSLTVVLIGCSEDVELPQSSYQIPDNISDGIEVSDAKEVGIEIELLDELEKDIKDGKYVNIHSILISKDNKLVYETYYAGKTVFGEPRIYGRSTPHNLHSATKSVNSALVGIALKQHTLSEEDTRILEFFDEFESELEPSKLAITVKDALSMSTGLKWDEWSFAYEDDRNDHQAMYNSGNWVHYVVSQPMAFNPGEAFRYNSGVSILLGAFVTKLTGMSVSAFSSEHLFSPLGITGSWQIGPLNTYQTGGGLSMTPRSMLKFGLLYLNDGNWNGNQIIDPEYVRKSTLKQAPNTGLINLEYGYQWWLTSYNPQGRIIQAYSAAGRGGQFIIVIDQLEMVVVFTGGNDNSLANSQPREILNKYILPASL